MPDEREVTEPPAAAEPKERADWIEWVQVIVLAFVTVATAWSGYQAARWSGIQARNYAQASTARALANRVSTLGGQERIQDLLNFNRWLEASTAGNTQLADLYERRFRDEFRPAFERWLADDPLHNVNAIPSPLREKNYVLANAVKADKLETLGDLRFEQGKAATEHSDDYVFITVFFAVVLFFGGISLRFAWTPMRLLILLMGAGLLIYGAIRISTLPAL